MTWDQGTSRAPQERRHLVAPGTYTWSTRYQNIAADASTTFTVCESVLLLCRLLG
jgi:hypothetical protein